MSGDKIAVTVSRMPEWLLDELETHFTELHDEHELDSDYVHTLQMLIIGYGAAWDAVESMQQQTNEQRKEIERLETHIELIERKGYV